jgi:hypothetical protein
VHGGTTLKGGRFTTLLPVHVALDIGVDAHIVSPSVTYGLTPDADVNLTLELRPDVIPTVEIGYAF